MEFFKHQNKIVKFILKRNILLFIFFLFSQVLLGQAPQNSPVCPNGSIILTSTNDTGIVYQWQINTGNGFTNLTDGSHYSGPGTYSMQLINLPSSWYGYQYRCVVDGVPGNVYALQFVTDWLGITDNWSDPNNWSCGNLPDSTTDVIIPFGGEVIVDVNAACRSLVLDLNSSVRINTGVNLTIVH